MTRQVWVDCAKGLGIVLVVYGHVARGIYTAGIPIHPLFFIYVDSVVYSFHMPLFFFLAGLFIKNSFDKRGKYKFIGNKLDTIFYPFLIWSFLQGGLELAFSNVTNGNVTFADVAASVWSPRAHFWFLHSLLLMCLAYFVIRVVAARATDIITLGVALVLFFIAPGGVSGGLAHYFIFFSCGIAISSFRLSPSAKMAAPLLVSFVVAEYFALRTGVPLSKSIIWVSLGLPLLGIATVITISGHIKPLAGLGRLSMEIYIMHVIAASGIRIILHKGFGITDPTVHLVTGTAFGLFGPVLVAYALGRLSTNVLFKPAKRLSAEAFLARRATRSLSSKQVG